MNEPIVSPWLIYWAGRIDMIQGICCIVGFFVTIYAVFVALAAMTAFNSNDKDVKAAFAALLNGKDEIIKLPWKPKAGEQYYSFGGRFFGDPTVWIVIDVIWQGLAYDVAIFEKGWVYRTQEEAEAALPAVAAEMGVEYEL